ncbi:MAG TPA: hypothetical protein VLL25_14870, partial [Acidimicrobiales bacterium]|nr:hypothetical protein [Acidimicrobiales bacterium]
MARSSGWGTPEATATTIVDGWLRSRDIATRDDLGYLCITDRKNDMYIMGGFNVAPVEVEKAVMGLGKVGQVAVVAMPDERFVSSVSLKYRSCRARPRSPG